MRKVRHLHALSCRSHFYINTRKSWIFCFLFANRVHKHTFSYKFTRRRRNLSTHTHTPTLVAIQKVQSFVRFVKDTVSLQKKKEEIEHLHTEKKTFIQDLGRFKMKFCRRQQSYDRERQLNV